MCIYSINQTEDQLPPFAANFLPEEDIQEALPINLQHIFYEINSRFAQLVLIPAFDGDIFQGHFADGVDESRCQPGVGD